MLFSIGGYIMVAGIGLIRDYAESIAISAQRGFGASLPE